MRHSTAQLECCIVSAFSVCMRVFSLRAVWKDVADVMKVHPEPFRLQGLHLSMLMRLVSVTARPWGLWRGRRVAAVQTTGPSQEQWARIRAHSLC